MLKYVSYDDMFETIPIYTTNIEQYSHYDYIEFESKYESPLVEVPYEYALDFMVSGISSFVILKENDKAYYTGIRMLGTNTFNYYAESIVNEESTNYQIDYEIDEKYIMGTIHEEHEKVIVIFNFIPPCVMKLKHDSPVQFKSINDFHTFLYEYADAEIDYTCYIEGFTIPLTENEMFDATRSKELNIHARRYKRYLQCYY